MIKLNKAQQAFSSYPQTKVDQIFKHVALVANQHRLDLAKFAVGETEKGVIEDKVIKNHFASEFIYNRYKNEKSCDVIERDNVNGIIKVAEPIGPIAGIVPVTNPTSTIIFKTLLALKTRNAVMFSPHPGAQRVSAYTVQLLLNAAVEAGAPADIIACTAGRKELTQHVLSHPDIHFILATGGPSVVDLSYHSGKPAIGVGAGNCPALIDETADLQEAVSGVIISKTFDSGMICAAENSCVVVDTVYNQVKDLFLQRGAYICSPEEKKLLSQALILQPGHRLNGHVVGKTAIEIAAIAGFSVPESTVCLIGEASEIGKEEAMSYEKLCPVLGLYRASDFKDGVQVAKRLASFGGVGHTSVLYTAPDNRVRIEEYEREMPTFRKWSLLFAISFY
jgi:acetaldehyde dehydrogenase/alcohol dehydrogenase